MERRNTKQRQIVLDVVRSRCDHPTVEQIYEAVSKIDGSISLGTVYRNLSILAEENLIKNIKLSDADRYDLRTDDHDHFVCEKCGKVFDVENEDVKVNNMDGFIINSRQIIYRGICSDCNVKN